MVSIVQYPGVPWQKKAGVELPLLCSLLPLDPGHIFYSPAILCESARWCCSLRVLLRLLAEVLSTYA